MKRAARQPYIALAAELNELDQRDNVCVLLCSLCKYGASREDDLDCQHPVHVVNEALANQMWNADIDDCWGFQPWRPLEKARALFLAAIEDMRVEANP